MNRLINLLILLASLALALAAASCATCDNGDDDTGGQDDDTLPLIDDDSVADDDAVDDDAVDDDAADDDTTDDDTTDDDATDDDTADDDTTGPLVDINFDDYALGPLGPPWTVDAHGTSTATIQTILKTGSGQELHIHGGLTTDDYLIAGYQFGPADFSINVSFDYWHDAGDSGRFDLAETGASIELIARMGSDDSLFVNGVTCAALNADQWYNIGFAVDYSAATYDVLLDGAATSCTGDAFMVGGYPLGWLYFEDEYNDGLGGDVYFDNLLVTAAP
jgi:hypothetical protein